MSHELTPWWLFAENTKGQSCLVSNDLLWSDHFHLSLYTWSLSRYSLISNYFKLFQIFKQISAWLLLNVLRDVSKSFTFNCRLYQKFILLFIRQKFKEIFINNKAWKFVWNNHRSTKVAITGSEFFLNSWR